jgi:hypothetical protein
LAQVRLGFGVFVVAETGHFQTGKEFIQGFFVITLFKKGIALFPKLIVLIVHKSNLIGKIACVEGCLFQ